jgi:hypothetical protein
VYSGVQQNRKTNDFRFAPNPRYGESVDVTERSHHTAIPDITRRIRSGLIGVRYAKRA